MLGHPLIDADANPASDVGTLSHRSHPFLHEGEMFSVLPYAPADIHSPQVGAEAYPAGCHPSAQSTGPSPLPLFNAVTFSSYASSNSTLRGSEDFTSVPVIASRERMYTDHVMATNLSTDEFNVTSDPSYQCCPSITRSPSIRSQQSGANHLYALPEVIRQGRASPTCIHNTTSVPTVPLTPSGIPPFSPVTLSQDQVASRDRPQQLRQLDKEPATAFPARRPASSSRSAGTHKAPKGPYPCENCDKTFACCQVLYRHQREKHEPDWCIFCGDFKWARPYLLRDHLRKKHPELDTDAALADAKKARRRVTMTSRLSTHRQDSPSAAECPQWNCGDLHAGSSHANGRNIETGCVWDSESVEEAPSTVWEAEG